MAEATSAMMTGRSSMSASSAGMPLSSSSSGSSSSRPPMSARRSLAHTPRLLGIGDDGLIPMHGLGISPTASEHTRLASGVPHSAKSVRTPMMEEELEEEDHRFKIDEEAEAEPREEEAQDSLERSHDDKARTNYTRQSGENRRKSPSMLAPIKTSYATLAGWQAEQGEASAMIGQENDLDPSGTNTDLERNGSAKHTPHQYTEVGGDDSQQDGEEEDLEFTGRVYFEPITAREKAWMWTSVSLVAILTTVSILIAVNLLDWWE